MAKKNKLQTAASEAVETNQKPKKDYKIVVSSPGNDDATGFSVDVNGRNVTLQYDEEEEVTADVYHALKDAVKVGVKKVKQTNDEGKVEWVQQPITIPRYTMVGQKI